MSITINQIENDVRAYLSGESDEEPLYCGDDALRAYSVALRLGRDATIRAEAAVSRVCDLDAELDVTRGRLAAAIRVA